MSRSATCSFEKIKRIVPPSVPLRRQNVAPAETDIRQQAIVERLEGFKLAPDHEGLDGAHERTADEDGALDQAGPEGKRAVPDMRVLHGQFSREFFCSVGPSAG
jgi:hypothetical protein